MTSSVGVPQCSFASCKFNFSCTLPTEVHAIQGENVQCIADVLLSPTIAN